MFAVIKTGGKQYKVAANDVLKVEKLPAEEGQIVTFDQVLMVGNGDSVTVGAPLVAGALVAAEFLGNQKNKTVLIVKKHRRQHYDRRNGHRQLLSSVRITEILLDGAKPTIEARAKKVAPAAEAAPEQKGKRARKTAKVSEETAVVEAAQVTEPAPIETDAPSEEGPAKKPARKTAAKKTAAAPQAGDEAPAKPARKRATKKTAKEE
jgi:large subunit ribosomal protein L21